MALVLFPNIDKPSVANASAPYRGQNRQNREKKVSGSKKLPFPSAPEMGALSQNIRQSAHFWGTGK